jgi:putative FmdB family regulatory protein
MPTYVYQCSKGHQFELFHSISDETPRKCPKCGSKAKRIPSGGAGLLFKGSGFYITDYRSQGYQDKAKSEAPPKPDSKGDKKADTGGSAKAAGDKKKPA